MAYFQMISEWHIRAPVGDVYRALSQYGEISTWWPSFLASVRSDAGSVRYCVRGLFGAELCFTQRTEVERPPESIQFSAEGDLQGTGVWSLHQRGKVTRVVFSWNVDLASPLQRALSRLPGVRWLLVRSHARVMAEGERCLQARLCRPAEVVWLPRRTQPASLAHRRA